MGPQDWRNNVREYHSFEARQCVVLTSLLSRMDVLAVVAAHVWLKKGVKDEGLGGLELGIDVWPCLNLATTVGAGVGAGLAAGFGMGLGF